MLGKLLKYDLKSTLKVMLPIYVALIIISIINKIFLFSNWNQSNNYSSFLGDTLFFILNALYIVIIVGTLILTLLVAIQHFYKNLLCDQGYLMWTLPVKTSHHILSKFLVSIFWYIASLFIIFLSTFISLPNIFSEISISIGEFFDIFYSLFNGNLGTMIAIIFFFITALLTSIGSSIMSFYACIAIGHLSTKHKILASVLAYLAISTILQMIGSIIFSLIFSLDISSKIEALIPYLSSLIVFCFAIPTIINILTIGIFYAITHFILSKKLNLQ